VCTKQDQEREKGIQLGLHVLAHTLAITVSAMVSADWAPCQEWKLFLLSMNCVSLDSIIEVFYNLNKMLIATKLNADNDFVFQ